VLVVAAAVGGRDHPDAALVAGAAARRPRWAAMVARHAITDPAIHGFRDGVGVELRRELLRASPLTQVFAAPTGASEEALRTVDGLLGRPGGRQLLHRELVTPTCDAAVLAWREELLDIRRITDVPFVLDTYVCAAIHHGRQWSAAILAAAGAHNSTRVPPTADAVATLRYWP
jgi:FtsH ternary system domain X1